MIKIKLYFVYAFWSHHGNALEWRVTFNKANADKANAGRLMVKTDEKHHAWSDSEFREWRVRDIISLQVVVDVVRSRHGSGP